MIDNPDNKRTPAQEVKDLGYSADDVIRASGDWTKISEGTGIPVEKLKKLAGLVFFANSNKSTE